MNPSGIIKPGEFALASDFPVDKKGIDLKLTYIEWGSIGPSKIVRYPITFDIEGFVQEGYRLYLQDNFKPTDLRREFFFRNSSKNKAPLPNKYFPQPDDYNFQDMASDIFTIRYAEVLLNRAEALAMLNQNEQARATLQQLREKRLTDAQLADIPTDNEKLVEFIRTERRMELCFEGHRWFDLRRYAVNSRYPLAEDFAITHPAYSYDAVSNTYYHIGDYRLGAFKYDQAAWMMPIPSATITFNEGTLTNLLRQTRTIIKN
jgi:hypothetical protein